MQMNSENGAANLGHRLGVTVKALLAIAAVTAVYGHLGSPHLSITTNFISDYAAAGYHWPWICLTMALFGLIYFLVAFSALHFSTHCPSSRIAGMAFAAGGLCMFFVAYYPTTRNGKGIAIWDPKDMWRQGWDAAYSNAHFDMIRMALFCLFVGISITSSCHLRVSGRQRHAMFSLILAAMMACLFVAGHSFPQHGLFQRSGFVLNWIWVWITASQLGFWANDNLNFGGARR